MDSTEVSERQEHGYDPEVETCLGLITHIRQSIATSLELLPEQIYRSLPCRQQTVKAAGVLSRSVILYLRDAANSSQRAKCWGVLGRTALEKQPHQGFAQAVRATSL